MKTWVGMLLTVAAFNANAADCPPVIEQEMIRQFREYDPQAFAEVTTIKLSLRQHGSKVITAIGKISGKWEIGSDGEKFFCERQ